MNHGLKLHPDGTLEITMPRGVNVGRVLVCEAGTQNGALYYRDNDVPETNVGEWIKDSEKYDAITHICSVCGSTMTTLKSTIANYCWHCGAMMTSNKTSNKR